MNAKLNVLFLSQPSLFERWGDEVVASLAGHHNLRILEDFDQPLAPQFEDIDVVIDHGGSLGTREMADLAVQAAGALIDANLDDEKNRGLVDDLISRIPESN